MGKRVLLIQPESAVAGKQYRELRAAGFDVSVAAFMYSIGTAFDPKVVHPDYILNFDSDGALLLESSYQTAKRNKCVVFSVKPNPENEGEIKLNQHSNLGSFLKRYIATPSSERAGHNGLCAKVS